MPGSASPARCTGPARICSPEVAEANRDVDMRRETAKVRRLPFQSRYPQLTFQVFHLCSRLAIPQVDLIHLEPVKSVWIPEARQKLIIPMAMQI